MPDKKIDPEEVDRIVAREKALVLDIERRSEQRQRLHEQDKDAQSELFSEARKLAAIVSEVLKNSSQSFKDEFFRNLVVR